MEKAFLEVLDIRCFSLPEKTGKVFSFENNFVVPNVLTDAVITLSGF